MTGTVSELNLATATDSDDTELYLTGPLATNQATIGGKFAAAGGHGHTGAVGDAPKIGSGGLANGAATGAALGADVITTSILNTGAWTAFTPTLTQGVALTFSSATGRYIQVGKTVTFSIDLTISGAGTAGSSMIFGGFPVASAQRGAFSGDYFDISATQVFGIVCIWNAGTTMAVFASGGQASSGNGFGNTPAVTAAVNDNVHLSGTYEAA